MKNKIVFFDFDYTLAKTTEGVWIWSPRGTRSYKGECYRVVNPLEYNVLSLGDDEFIDERSFKEFNKINILDAKPIRFNLMLLNFFMSENVSVFILSARPQQVENDVFRFLEKHKIKNHNNILFKGCASSDPSKKYDYIKEKTLSIKPSEVFLFDDSKKVIECAKKFFKKDFSDIEFTACLVSNDKESLCMCFG
tara:strand:- start:445 stop:1026 length:582 start_codon:yes stop_codon:yes gene_type:complete